MNVCTRDITDSLKHAVEISQSLINTEKLSNTQEKALYLAFDFIQLCKRFFTININRKELEILQMWTYQKDKDDVKELFLAKKENNNYLFATFINQGVKALGIHIQENELPYVQSMNSKEVIKYFNRLIFSK